MLPAAQYDDSHRESLLNAANWKRAQQTLNNLRMSCNVAGNCVLQVSAGARVAFAVFIAPMSGQPASWWMCFPASWLLCCVTTACQSYSTPTHLLPSLPPARPCRCCTATLKRRCGCSACAGWRTRAGRCPAPPQQAQQAQRDPAAVQQQRSPPTSKSSRRRWRLWLIYLRQLGGSGQTEQPTSGLA